MIIYSNCFCYKDVVNHLFVRSRPNILEGWKISSVQGGANLLRQMVAALSFKFETTSKRFGAEKCPLYLKLPWIGNISLKYEKQTSQ